MRNLNRQKRRKMCEMKIFKIGKKKVLMKRKY